MSGFVIGVDMSPKGTYRDFYILVSQSKELDWRHMDRERNKDEKHTSLNGSGPERPGTRLRLTTFRPEYHSPSKAIHTAPTLLRLGITGLSMLCFVTWSPGREEIPDILNQLTS